MKKGRQLMPSSGTVPQAKKGVTISPFTSASTCMKKVLAYDFSRSMDNLCWIVRLIINVM